MKTNNKSIGFSMNSTNQVPTQSTNNKANYGKTMVDAYGRCYLQTEHGKIY